MRNVFDVPGLVNLMKRLPDGEAAIPKMIERVKQVGFDQVRLEAEQGLGKAFEHALKQEEFKALQTQRGIDNKDKNEDQALARETLGVTKQRDAVAASQGQQKINLDLAKFADEKRVRDFEKRNQFAKQLSGKLADDLVGRVATQRVEDSNADETLKDVTEGRKILDSGDFVSGFGAGARLGAERAINLVNKGNSAKIKNSEKLESILFKGVLSVLDNAQLKGPTSDKDILLLRGIANGSLDKNPETLRDGFDALERKAKEKKARYQSTLGEIPLSDRQRVGLADKPQLTMPGPKEIDIARKNPGAKSFFIKRFGVDAYNRAVK